MEKILKDAKKIKTLLTEQSKEWNEVFCYGAKDIRTIVYSSKKFPIIIVEDFIDYGRESCFSERLEYLAFGRKEHLEQFEQNALNIKSCTPLLKKKEYDLRKTLGIIKAINAKKITSRLVKNCYSYGIFTASRSSIYSINDFPALFIDKNGSSGILLGIEEDIKRLEEKVRIE